MRILELKNNLVKNKTSILFILKMFGIFLLLHSIYDYYIIPYTNLDNNLIAIIISQTEWIIELMGYVLLEPNSMYENHFGIQGSSGVVIGAPCDGLSLFILFTTFIVVFKGKLWFKGLYIIFGMSIIHFLNILRVLALALIVVYSPDSLDFHHKYSFTLFVYLSIFLMWYYRMNIYKKKNW